MTDTPKLPPEDSAEGGAGDSSSGGWADNAGGGETPTNRKQRIIVAGQEHRFNLRKDDYFHDEDGNEKYYESGKKVLMVPEEEVAPLPEPDELDDQQQQPQAQVQPPVQHLGHVAHRNAMERE